jgi:hypothetical protein
MGDWTMVKPDPAPLIPPHLRDLSAEEVATLRSIAKNYSGLGRLGKALFWIVAFLGALAALAYNGLGSINEWHHK